MRNFHPDGKLTPFFILLPSPLKFPSPFGEGLGVRPGSGGEAFISHLPRLQRKDHLFFLDDMHKLHAGGKPEAREVAA